MTAEKYILSRDLIIGRNNIPYYIAKFLAFNGYKIMARAHVELHDDIVPLKQKGDSVFLYASLHKSLWETTGILAGAIENGLPVPFTGMGDNLVRGKFFQSIAKKVGVFLIKRTSMQRRAVIESAKSLKADIMNYLAHGEDVLLFPEGTRKNILSQGTYGKFFPTVFDALLEYEKNKAEIMVANKELTPLNSYIIPVSVDYSKIREDREMLATYKGKPRTLHIQDSLKMIKNIGDTWLSYGKPIKVADHLEMSRKDLAVLAHEKCLESVKILPINVVARAIVDAYREGQFAVAEIETNITAVIKTLSDLQDRFRGFAADDPPRKIWESVSEREGSFKAKRINQKHLEFYRLYANYIAHYF